MAKFAKYTNLKKGFIEECKIQNGEIIVVLNGLKGKKNFKYNITLDNLNKYNERLKLQHDAIYTQKKQILNDNLTKTIVFVLIAIISGVVAPTILEGLVPEVINYISYGIFGISSIAGVGSCIKTVKDQKEIENKQIAFSCLDDINQAMEEDKNVTSGLSKQAQEILKINASAKKRTNYDYIFNPIAINEFSAKDLENIVLSFETYQDLERTIEPSAKPKTRVRKKEQ